MWTLFTHEVKYYFKNKAEAIYLYSYFISIVLLIPFALSAGPTQLQLLAPVALWIALASAASFGGIGLFTRDYDQGRLEYYQLLPISLEKIVFAKWAAFFCFLITPFLIVLPLTALLFAVKAAYIAHYALGLVAGAAALSLLATLAAVLMTGLEKAGAILGLVILPLTIPVMIFGTAYCRDVSSDWQPSLLFILGFTLFLLPVTCIAGAHSIRSAN